jgi:hypothetical protein
VRSPFQVDFAVRGMGVVPAGKALDGTGHHHILIDTPLPIDVRAAIPFSDTHRHFGKGQTGTVLDLPPGHPSSAPAVRRPRAPALLRLQPRDRSRSERPAQREALPIDPPQLCSQTCAAWYADELARPRPPGEFVTVLNLRDGEPVASPFNLRFGVDGYGVCAAGQQAERSGHFLLELRQDGRLVRRQDLTNGATQLNLSLPDGRYALRLRFVGAPGATCCRPTRRR